MSALVEFRIVDKKSKDNSTILHYNNPLLASTPDIDLSFDQT